MRESGKRLDAPILADRCRSTSAFRKAFDRYRRIPAIRFTLDLAGRNLAHRARSPANLYRSDSGKAQDAMPLPTADFEPRYRAVAGCELKTVAMRFVTPARKPIERFESREAGRLTSLATA